jgi:hypothetical protein
MPRRVSRALPAAGRRSLVGTIDGLLLQHFLDDAVLDPEALRRELRRIARRILSP